MKFSKQREVILEVLRKYIVHPRADFIYDQVRKEIPSVSLGTVYRNLKQLSEQGIIRSIEGLDDVTRFDHNMCRHHHFICTKCKNVYDIADSPPQSWIENISDHHGFVIEDSDIMFKGICNNCRHN